MEQVYRTVYSLTLTELKSILKLVGEDASDDIQILRGCLISVLLSSSSQNDIKRAIMMSLMNNTNLRLHQVKLLQVTIWHIFIKTNYYIIHF